MTRVDAAGVIVLYLKVIVGAVVEDYARVAPDNLARVLPHGGLYVVDVRGQQRQCAVHILDRARGLAHALFAHAVTAQFRHGAQYAQHHQGLEYLVEVVLHLRSRNYPLAYGRQSERVVQRQQQQVAAIVACLLSRGDTLGGRKTPPSPSPCRVFPPR